MELGEEHSLRIVSEDGFEFTDFTVIEPFFLFLVQTMFER